MSEKRKGKTDWKRVDALTDADIATAVQNDPDTSEAGPDWFRNAMILRPATDKEPVTVRLDSDMVAWFRRQGRGYQTRINAILRSYYEAHRNESRR
ncbi:MAG: BrnA antitoxin family protein [Bryobacteraceae bacterium]